MNIFPMILTGRAVRPPNFGAIEAPEMGGGFISQIGAASAGRIRFVRHSVKMLRSAPQAPGGGAS